MTMKFLFEKYGNMPTCLIDTLARTADIKVDSTLDHAPHRAMPVLYPDPLEAHLRIMALNCKSPLSLRQGDILHLYDRDLLRTFDA